MGGGGVNGTEKIVKSSLDSNSSSLTAKTDNRKSLFGGMENY